ncbi:MAG: hypothetical protein DRN90_00260 [Thermoproteota archaeon]|nr:MAG: hypothetical protein DRN90_00260 [Candidatus Korarchaeota archaeon]
MRWNPLWRVPPLKVTQAGNYKFEGKDMMLVFKKKNGGYAVTCLVKLSGEYTHVGGYVFISKHELKALLEELEKGKR